MHGNDVYDWVHIASVWLSFDSGEMRSVTVLIMASYEATTEHGGLL
jgi:hypothetical protein